MESLTRPLGEARPGAHLGQRVNGGEPILSPAGPYSATSISAPYRANGDFSLPTDLKLYFRVKFMNFTKMGLEVRRRPICPTPTVPAEYGIVVAERTLRRQLKEWGLFH